MWRTAALTWACLWVVAETGAVGARAPVTLSGAWELNRELSSAPGGPPPPDGGGRGGPGGGPGGAGPGGGFPGGGGGGGGGFGGRGGRGGGRPGGGPPAGRPSKDDVEARRALMGEVLQPPPRITIAQDGDKVSFIEPDGVVRTYLANDRTEKHAMTNGTVETRSRWDKAALRMSIVLDRTTVIRTFEIAGDDPRRLRVTTAFDRGPKDAAHVAVYDLAPGR